MTIETAPSRVSFQGTLSETEIDEGIALTSQGFSRIVRIGMVLLLLAYGVWVAVTADSFILLGIATLALYLGVLIRQSLGHRFHEMSRTDKRFSLPLHGIVSNLGIEVKGDGFAHFLPWSEYLYYKMSPTMVLFYRTGSILSLFPRTYFASDSEWQAFQQIVQHHVAEYPKGHSYTIQPQ
jgi:hypothetical protein